MDPHKRSVTIEVRAADETVLGGGRFGTDVAGYLTMLDHVAPVAGPGLGHRGLRRHRTTRRDPAGG